MAKNKKKIDVEQVLLENRQVFLFSAIGSGMSELLTRELVALDKLNHKPIVLWINSPGGALTDGYCIIDTMIGIKSPVITLGCGMVGSMAGAILLVGDERLMTDNSIWMGHDMSGGVGSDSFGKVLTRSNFMKRYRDKYFNLLETHTKLTKKDIKIIQTEEMWLDAKECLKKGLIDKIVSTDKVNYLNRKKTRKKSRK